MEETSLKLIALRNNYDGHYLGYDAMACAAAKYEIPLVKCWTPSDMGIETTDRVNFTLFEKKIKQTVCERPTMLVYSIYL
jgi:hypothetical protein